MQATGGKRCSKCTATKEVGEFPRGSGKDGLSVWCRQCHNDCARVKREAAIVSQMDALPTDWRMEKLGPAIAAGRTTKRWSQSELGAAVGVTGSQVRLWEKGKSIPQARHLAKLAEVLTLEIPDVLRVKDGGRRAVGIGQCKACDAKFLMYRIATEFCSRRCCRTFLNTDGAVGRSKTGDGYIQVKVAADPADPNCRRWRLEHHVVMEQKLGRPLAKHERVHHKNGIRDDNQPDNLELWIVRGRSKKDPAGQRLEDLLDFIAANYAAEMQARLNETTA